MRQYPEDDLQIKAARFIDRYVTMMIEKTVLWAHPANERKASIQAGRRLKMKGVSPGVPDIMIYEPNGTAIGLAVELKIKPNKLSDDQKRWLTQLYLNGWETKVCWTFEEFEKTVCGYFGIPLKNKYNE
jgi:hypothetical protein